MDQYEQLCRPRGQSSQRRRANGTTKLDTTTVQNDSSAADYLIGGSEMDWFFQSVSDVLVDFNAGIGEIKTAI